MNKLPNLDKIVLPLRKFTEYALNPDKEPNKALVFQLALGYNIDNAEKLIENIKSNLNKFPAKNKGDTEYGTLYEVIMDIAGENRKTAKVLTAWIDDKTNGEMRLVTVHVD